MLFNRSHSKDYFDAPELVHERVRPLSISVTAWCLLIGAASMIIAAILRSPAMLFGIILTGWVALVVYAALAALQMYLGTGLLHLHEKARIAAIVYFCFGFVNLVVSLMRPGYAEMVNQMQAAIPRFFPAGGPSALPGSLWFLAAPTVACNALLIYFLVRRRSAFH